MTLLFGVWVCKFYELINFNLVKTWNVQILQFIIGKTYIHDVWVL
jgi:hypothetical protein